MSTGNLEERVAALETRFAELLKSLQTQPSRHAWRTVVGMFADDPEIEELHREAQRFRDEDRMATASENQSDT